MHTGCTMPAAGAERTLQVFLYEKQEDSAMIWRCFSRDAKALIPSEISGLTVTRLAPYAFSAHQDEEELLQKYVAGELLLSESPLFYGMTDIRALPVLAGDQLEEIVLPESVTTVGRYCFYNCRNLHRISFTAAFRDLGSGSFTGCHRVNRITVRTDPQGTSMLKEVLDEVKEELLVELIPGGDKAGETEDTGKALLMFPEFFEEGVENTPARILVTHVHGTGILYRNCFRGRRIEMKQYDALFPHAAANESEELLVRMALGRLMYPYQLYEEAYEQYRTFAVEHPAAYASWLVKQRDATGIRWMLGFLGKDGFTFAEAVSRQAAQSGFPEAQSLAAEYRRQNGGTRRRRRRFEL